MKSILSIIILLLLTGAYSQAQINSQNLDFEFEGIVLNGVLYLPDNLPPKGMVLIVRGSGKTDAVTQDWLIEIE